MPNKIKSAAAILAACALMITGNTYSYAAGGGTEETIQVGDNLTATISADQTTVTVSGYGSLDETKWKDLKSSRLTSLVGNTSLKKISFQVTGESNVISFPENSKGLFSFMPAAEIEFPATGIDTSKVTDMSEMFSSAAVANPNVSNWDTSKVTNMRSMFQGAEKATPNVSNWDTSKVTNMSYMFSAASAATPDVSRWNTGNVTNMRNMFRMAYSANPDVSRWNTSKIKDARGMFYYATSANPDVSNWDLSGNPRMNTMFEGAKNVKLIDISKWRTDAIRKDNRATKIFHTGGETTLRVDGKHLEDLKKPSKGIVFKAGVKYNIVEESAAAGPARGLYNEAVDGADAQKLLEIANYDYGKTYLIRPNPTLTVTAKSQTLNLGEAVTKLDYDVSPADLTQIVEGELATGYTAQSKAGKYPVTQGGLKIKSDYAPAYNLSFVAGNITVEKAPHVVEGAWVDLPGKQGQDCLAKTVSQVSNVTITPYKWDDANSDWVLDEASVRTEVRNKTRVMTESELAACVASAPNSSDSTKPVLAKTSSKASSKPGLPKTGV